MKIKFSYIMLMMALSVAGCAGYFSVWGLSQLFAGASTAVITMATILEIGKVVTTTALHRYWSKLAKSLKIYLTISVGVLMLITSAGIYGFLSNAYQSTANKLEIHEGELGVLDGKKTLFEKNINDNEKIVVTKNKRIDQLSNLRTNQENRLDSAKTNRSKDKVRGDIQNATNEIQKLTNDIDDLNTKNSILSDSVNKYNTKTLELKANNNVTSEVGPLKYIAELTGAPMAKVVNYLILLLIFVFDPLAIALILMTNRVFQLEGNTNQLISTIVDKTPNIINEETPEVIENTYNSDDDYIDNDDDTEVNEEFANEWKKRFDELEEIKKNEKGLNETPIETKVEPQLIKKEPVVTTGKIELEDIKEIKEGNRGYSVKVPQPKSNNTIERIGSNKVVKNGNNNKLFFKRK